MRHVPFSLILDHSMMSTLEIWTLLPYWSPMSSIIKKSVLERVISIWEVFYGNTEFNRSIRYWTTLKCYMKSLSIIYVVRFDKIDGSASEVTCASQPSTRMELRHLQITMVMQYKYNNMSNLMKEFTRGLKRNDVRAQSNLVEKDNSSSLKDDSSSRTDPSIFTSIALALLDRWKETNWVLSALKSTGHFQPQSSMSCRSNSRSAAKASCYHKSDAWSHLE